MQNKNVSPGANTNAAAQGEGKICNIKVAVRVRPLLKNEKIAGQKSTRIVSDEERNEIQ